MPIFGPNIQKMKERNDVNGLIKELENKKDHVRVAAVTALAELENVKGLILSLDNSLSEVHNIAIKSLKEMDTSEVIEKVLSKGHEYARAGDMNAAIEWFRQTISIYPNSAEASFVLGSAYQFVELLDEAQVQFENVIILDPSHKAAYSSLAGCLSAKLLQKENKYKSVNEIFSEETQNLYNEVEKFSMKAIELGDMEPYTYITRALALAYLGRGEEAYQMTSEANGKLNEEGRELFADKLAKLGLVYVQIKRDQSNGRWCLLAAKKLNPQDLSVRQLEGELEMFDRSNKDKMSDEMTRLVNLCENDPDKGLETIQSLMEKDFEPQFVSFLKFCRAMAYGSKGLFQEMWNKSWTEISFSDGKNELQERLGLSKIHLDYLEFALQEIHEIENTDPDFLNMIGTEDERMGELRIGVMATALERCRPGRTQQILGKTKLQYFGIDRVKFMPKNIFGRVIDPDDLTPFMNAFFSFKLIAKSALVTHQGFDKQGKYIWIQLFEKTLDEFGVDETFGDARPTTSPYDVKLYVDGSFVTDQEKGEEYE